MHNYKTELASGFWKNQTIAGKCGSDESFFNILSKKESKGGDFITEIGDNFNDFELQLICEIRY